MRNLTGFILAGGQSKRMGCDKALLDWHGRALLEHMAALLLAVTDSVRTVGRSDFPDRIPGRGPLGGIEMALEVSSTENNIVVAVDLPFLTVQFLEYLRFRLESTDRPLVVPRVESRFPLCLGLRRTILRKLKSHLDSNDRSIQNFVAVAGSEVIAEEDLVQNGFEASLFRNLNTHEDYVRLRDVNC